MNYLVNWCKHNCIWFALCTVVASFAALYSVFLVVCIIPILVLLIYRQFPYVFIGCLVGWTIGLFLYFQYVLVDDVGEMPNELTMSSRYTINGDKLRGFMSAENGRKYYVVYTFLEEQEKQRYMERSIAGKKFTVEQAEWQEQKELAHPYMFSMQTYLKSHNASGPLNVEVWYAQENERKQTLYYALVSMRYRINAYIARTFPPSLAAEAQALLFGDQQHVDESLTRAYQKLGITHLFAISGLHITLLAVGLYEGLIRCRVKIELAKWFVVIALPIYGVLAGEAPSVWRAVLLAEVIFICKLLKGRFTTDDALSIVCIVSIVLQPAIVLQIGFQLSYIACAALVYAGRSLQQKNWWQQGFLMTFYCQMLAYPILLFHFYELSLSSFFVNILFVPLFSFIILPINALLLLVSPIRIVSEPLFHFYTPLRELLTELIYMLQRIPYQLWIAGKPSLILMSVMLLSVIVGFIISQSNRWLAAVIVATPICILTLKPYVTNDLVISFVDVGQGDCIVIELPHRQAVYVVDTGGLLRFAEEEWKQPDSLYEVGKQVVVPYLKGRGIGQIDALIVTHADADHVEGAEEVLREIRAKEIHITPNAWQKEIVLPLLEEAKRQRVPIVEKKQGDQWMIGQVKFHYLWPNDTHYEGNDDSLVLHMTYKAFTALLTGDLEEGGEQQLLASLQPITLLKAGHHGSKTSSSESFLQILQPQLSIFTAGANNRYKHPHEEVVTRFNEMGLRTLATKDVQTVVVTTNGQTYNVYP